MSHGPNSFASAFRQDKNVAAQGVFGTPFFGQESQQPAPFFTKLMLFQILFPFMSSRPTEKSFEFAKENSRNVESKRSKKGDRWGGLEEIERFEADTKTGDRTHPKRSPVSF